jgi:hypothetical protein
MLVTDHSVCGGGLPIGKGNQHQVRATIMSLKYIVESLINDGPSTSRYHRAIRLFEFQVSVFYPNSFKRLVAKENLTAPNKKLKTARVLAAIGILEKIEENLKQNKSISRISLQDLADDEDYRSVFDDEFVTNGGWPRIKQSISARAFDRGVETRSGEARAAANIVDFSYRFSKNQFNDIESARRNPGGVEAAKYVVRKACKPAVSASTIKSRWTKFKSPAIFLYLILNPKFNMRPPRVSSEDFADTLLRQAGNLEALRRYFRAYQIVRDSLLNHKYTKYPKLELDLESSTPQLDAPEFSSDMKKHFELWLKV